MSTNRNLEYLDAMGITTWVRREVQRLGDHQAPDAAADPARDRPPPEAAALPDNMDWQELAARVAVCTDCALHQGRTQTVFGVGDRCARVMVIGEAPGYHEDKQGEPFVGRAGSLLDRMLRAIGLSRETVFIANVLKCRPPNNRDPRPEESQACQRYLQRQIELLQPAIVLALGRVAAQHLLASDAPVGRLRGRLHQLPDTDIPLVVTYHPAYLLRSPEQKQKSLADLLLLRSQLGDSR